MNLEKHLTPGQVAEALQVSPKTIHNLVSLRQIESVKIGRVVRIPETAIERYLNEHRRGKR